MYRRLSDENGHDLAEAPGRPAHSFSYTRVDLESQYTPPVLTDVSMPETTYDYSLDRELEFESRPDGGHIDLQYDSATRLSRLSGVYRISPSVVQFPDTRELPL